jgi:hypothetical protein
MIIHCYNEKHKNLLFIDIEFDHRNLLQFAGLLFQAIDNQGNYQLYRSINQYRNPDEKVCYPFVEYTGLTGNFLAENGIPLESLKSLIFDDFLEGIPLEDLEIISHGLKNDRAVLCENGINLSNFQNINGITIPIDGYCTFKNSQRILGRKQNLKESDVAEEAGYYIHNAHNAFNDVWGEVAIFTYLKKVEQQSLN